jgi:2-polyprenyl-3-methyl-5-hydroxy-6-metoxy-1,4-benzoquinol methylase
MKINNKNYDMDPSNVTYFSKISDVYDLSGDVLLFHQQKYAPIIESIIQYFKKLKNIEDVRLLDIGIGYGAFLKECEKKGLKKLHGMDPFLISIGIAKKYTSADLRIGKIESLPWPFEENYFDVITCLDVVEHLKYPEIFFKNVKKYIVDNGIVVVRTPNGELPYLLRKFPFIGIKDDNPTHTNVHNPKYWMHLAEKNGFEILKNWKGEHLTHVNYINYLNKICNLINVDHRRVPLLNMFEQAYIMMIIKLN